MYELPEWPNKSSEWTRELLQILDEPQNVPPNLSLEEFLSKSENFPVNFPIDTVRCKSLKNFIDAKTMEDNINSAYPLVHESALKLYAQFLLYKRQFGTSYEKNVYKNMSVLKFVDRLLTKRAVMFMGKFDKYILIDGTKGTGKWNLIGKSKDSKLTLENCLSYDEIKLSVFLSVSSMSYFINDGTRKNYGKPDANRSNIQNEGIVIGLIGARLKKLGAMEYEEMVISKNQNLEKNGYGDNVNSLHKLFADFYEEPCFTYETVLELRKTSPERFPSVLKDSYFDNVVFAKRVALSIDTLLIEANERARVKNTTAYIHVVGIGLGVWKCSDHQEEVFVETFGKRLQALGKNIAAVTDIFFSYFGKVNNCGGCKSGSIMKIKDRPEGIKIYLGNRNPHTKLIGADAEKLLIVSYAWDGNSMPGNEFWSGKLASTGDSAAASSTQISELHNPHINSKVCAANLHVATSNGLRRYQDYRNSVSTGKRKRSSSGDSS